MLGKRRFHFLNGQQIVALIGRGIALVDAAKVTIKRSSPDFLSRQFAICVFVEGFQKISSSSRCQLGDIGRLVF